MTRRLVISLAVLLFAVSALTAEALHAATLSPKPQGAEIAFVSKMQSDLSARFATIADAEHAGYFRYTNEDNTGSISYVNLHWHSSDPAHPSQLWYDVHGNLLGADFSVPVGLSATAPTLWGVNPKRWIHIPAHFHWVVLGANGKESYHASSLKAFVSAGGDPLFPSAATLVAMKKVSSAGSVTHLFEYPSIWDLIVWIKPNPNGAFADKNPLVHPTKNAGMGGM
ncbi:MAG TPA: hypothetical protein VMV73_03650 [Candidatus Dormibacteraeota bacterium]|nr:hypothetical protein [Candidatus Dormibacteraeota bacterium]